MDVISREEAAGLGLKRYFTGLPCRNGHLSEHRVSDKQCIECRLHKQRVSRERNPEKWREYCRQHYARHTEERKAFSRSYKARHRDETKAYFKAWYAANRNEQIARNKQWKAENKTQVAASRLEYRRKNREKFNALLRAWIKANPIARRAYYNNRRTQLHAGGRHTPEDLKHILQLQKTRCALCKCALQRKKHLDHIIALSKGGSNERTNLQFLCVECNLRKNNKDQMEFMRALGFLL